jgi:hypothetical protein
MPQPYPEYPPNMTYVPEVDGLKRHCFVIEFLSPERITAAQKAYLTEQLETVLVRCNQTGKMPIEEMKVVGSERFDTQLLIAMRLRKAY